MSNIPNILLSALARPHFEPFSASVAPTLVRFAVKSAENRDLFARNWGAISRCSMTKLIGRARLRRDHRSFVSKASSHIFHWQEPALHPIRSSSVASASRFPVVARDLTSDSDTTSFGKCQPCTLPNIHWSLATRI